MTKKQIKMYATISKLESKIEKAKTRQEELLKLFSHSNLHDIDELRSKFAVLNNEIDNINFMVRELETSN